MLLLTLALALSDCPKCDQLASPIMFAQVAPKPLPQPPAKAAAPAVAKPVAAKPAQCVPVCKPVRRGLFGRLRCR